MENKELSNIIWNILHKVGKEYYVMKRFYREDKWNLHIRLDNWNYGDVSINHIDSWSLDSLFLELVMNQLKEELNVDILNSYKDDIDWMGEQNETNGK